MAALKFTSQELEGIFRLLVVLNSSLQFVIKELGEISGKKVLSAKYLSELETLTEEVRTTLNQKALK